MTLRTLILAASITTLAACSQPAPEATVDATDTVMTDTPVVAAPIVETETVMSFDAASLQAALDAQDETAKARYDARNPMETIQFFGITPGMAVGEALPGGGWYSKILLPYLGDEGRLVGVDYTIPMWGDFDFSSPEFLESKANWPATWIADARGWTDTQAEIDAYTFSSLPQDGSLDAFLFIRALHNLSRFDATGNFMTDAITSVHGSLKSGGIVGVVQHAAADDADAAWADGSAGYLREADVVAAFEAAGFQLVGSSDINANPLDNPTTDEIVWRLPPRLGTSAEDPDLRAEMEAIGESNRMTLLFRKP